MQILTLKIDSDEHLSFETIQEIIKGIEKECDFVEMTIEELFIEDYQYRMQKWVTKHQVGKGDYVEILRKPETTETWPDSWVSEMDVAINEVFEVNDVTTNGVDIYINSEDCYCFPFFVCNPLVDNSGGSASDN